MNILHQHVSSLEEKLKQGKYATLANFSIAVSEWTRPDFLSGSFFQQAITEKPAPHEDNEICVTFRFPDGTILRIDNPLVELFRNLIYAHPKDISADPNYRKYIVGKTKEAGQSDTQIVSAFSITRDSPIHEIFTTAGYLISKDMQNTELLYHVGMDGQENINIGYYLNFFTGLRMVFVERKKPTNDEIREYYIHESPVFRTYKKNRWFLAPLK